MSLTTTPTPLRILISGAGIAGPCLAHWLARTPISPPPKVTILERAPTLRATGQSIDIRGPAIGIVQKMGLQEGVRAKHTTEEGVRILGRSGAPVAEFGAGPKEGGGFTAEYEILRADLCGLVVESTKPFRNVEYRFGDYVTGLAQDAKEVNVTFNSGAQETYDLVVGADGASSKIRSLVLSGKDLENSYNFIGQYVAYFSIPSQKTDTRHWYWYNAPNGLALMTRPHRNPDTIGVYMCITTRAHGVRDARVEKAMDAGPEGQKKVLHEVFKSVGWQAERILEGLDICDDFYMSRCAQVKLPTWHAGRAVLLGDAAFATFGVGTSLAIHSAYTLASELAKIKSSDDIPRALDDYEKAFREIYKKSEDLPLGYPQIAFPQTSLGLKLRDSLAWLVSKTKVYKLLPEDDGMGSEVAEYPWRNI
ncbi:flavo protein monooxygenase [Setomelanomma holmii]|uniref:Flavo protein monooxygenase n=1 Tax=Setomelanomma holmii TaxID=210430 RepID=A0A9P4GZQ1_9PLEO|nr:flavo protein monooxygenase [Setomelanomma holmii]